MEKVHGAGVGNYISGGFKIAAGAGLAALSFVNVVTAVNTLAVGNSAKVNCLTLGIAAFASAGLFTDGITQILNEQRMRKLEKK